jgi:hypothetical protein
MLPQLARVKHSAYGFTMTIMKQKADVDPPKLAPPYWPPPGCVYHEQQMQCGEPT